MHFNRDRGENVIAQDFLIVFIGMGEGPDVLSSHQQTSGRIFVEYLATFLSGIGRDFKFVSLQALTQLLGTVNIFSQQD